jgi:hypothetical protein
MRQRREALEAERKAKEREAALNAPAAKKKDTKKDAKKDTKKDAKKGGAK